MNDARDRREETIRAALRRGDPAGDDREPDSAEVARWRRRILEAVPAGPAADWRPSFAMLTAAAVLIVAFAGVALWKGVSDRRDENGRIASEVAASQSIVAAGSSGDPAAEIAPGRPARKVEFTTAGGTRIVWILNPDLQI